MLETDTILCIVMIGLIHLFIVVKFICKKHPKQQDEPQLTQEEQP